MTESPQEYADDDEEEVAEVEQDEAQDPTDEPFEGNVPPDEEDHEEVDPS